MINVLEIHAVIPTEILKQTIELSKIKSYIEEIGWKEEAKRNGNSVYQYHVGSYERIILPVEIGENPFDMVLGVSYRDALETLWRVNQIPSFEALNRIVGLSVGEEENALPEIKETVVVE